ncbi:uncharacterized protein LOC118824793 isoform X8 [Colossoma macropomum]|uniref:uncharacterized protein LOC118824793 isoform X7 n=1 Tax=Colossoma macropomum TaxID=42526 RepID=UPI0018650D57|nr:uncharacterized protein LOC118824793 isoform X7 [Colossoma macropomum]XP_036451096.1 uncharacterized protein LOC118824793 isoform X8 [Colossoma macropomum]
MRAGVSVLLLVALAGLESVLSASLEAVGGQDLLDETADEISDLQKRDDITLEVAGAEEGESLEDGNFMEATRDEIEVHSEMTQEEETEVAHMTREGDTDDEEAAAEVDAAAESLETMEEESKESEEHVEVEEIKDLDEDSEDASQEEGALEE